MLNQNKKIKNINSPILYLSLLLLVLLGACTFEKKEELFDCSLLESISLEQVVNTRCGEALGSIEVSVVTSPELTEPVTFSINGGEATTESLFESLNAGTYEISASINGNCNQLLNVTIENEDGLNISLEATNSDCGQTNGQIEVTSTNASGTVQYKIDESGFQNEAIFNAVSPGVYTITAKDDAGCEVSQEVKVLSKVAFAEIQTIINTNCALSGCHGGGISPNLTTPESIEQFADRILQRTSNQSMPPSSSGLSLQPSEIDAIACWVFDNN